MTTSLPVSALQLDNEQACTIYCAAMLGMVVAFHGKDRPEPHVMEMVEKWSLGLRKIGESNVVLTLAALQTSLGLGGEDVAA
jgi:hypothetical protein